MNDAWDRSLSRALEDALRRAGPPDGLASGPVPEGIDALVDTARQLMRLQALPASPGIADRLGALLAAEPFGPGQGPTPAHGAPDAVPDARDNGNRPRASWALNWMALLLAVIALLAWKAITHPSTPPSAPAPPTARPVATASATVPPTSNASSTSVEAKAPPIVTSPTRPPAATPGARDWRVAASTAIATWTSAPAPPTVERPRTKVPSATATAPPETATLMPSSTTVPTRPTSGITPEATAVPTQTAPEPTKPTKPPTETREPERTRTPVPEATKTPGDRPTPLEATPVPSPTRIAAARP